MQKKDPLRKSTRIIATSINWISITSLLMLFFEDNMSAGFVGLIFAFLLPAVVCDRRKYLRGFGASIGWAGISLLVIGIYMRQSMYMPFIGFGCALIAGISECFITKINLLKFIRRTSMSLNVRVCTSALLTSSYLCFTTMLFLYAFSLNRVNAMVMIILLMLSAVSLLFTIYYWSWGIKIEKEQLTIVRFGKNSCPITGGSISKVIVVPFGNYFVLGTSCAFVFCFSDMMEGSSQLFLFLRSKMISKSNE